MNNALSIVFLLAGVVLVIFGINAMHSFGSEVSTFFSGSPSNKAVWLLLGGVVAVLGGMAGLFHGSKA
jgi:hypothetical protein